VAANETTTDAQDPKLDGIIILDKPAGITSAAAVNRVKQLLPRGTRIGHAGTLDSFATGVLILLIGRATRQCEALMDQSKQYHATIRLGATTVTDDPQSAENPTGAAPAELSQIEDALGRLTGVIQQVPPSYSAVKLAGVRASDRVRAGEQITLKPRTVRIYSIELLHYEWPDLELRIDCGRGTYIRSMARDIGLQLQTGGYLLCLRRTRIGPFDAAAAVTLDQLDRQAVASRLIRLPLKVLHPRPSPL
jgi:tRNA pseudouridine55 synthase